MVRQTIMVENMLLGKDAHVMAVGKERERKRERERERERR
jgi:hypothetical protein